MGASGALQALDTLGDHLSAATSAEDNDPHGMLGDCPPSVSRVALTNSRFDATCQRLPVGATQADGVN